MNVWPVWLPPSKLVSFPSLLFDAQHLTTALHFIKFKPNVPFLTLPFQKPQHTHTLLLQESHPGATLITQCTGGWSLFWMAKDQTKPSFYTWTYANPHTHTYTYTFFYTPQSHWGWTLWLMTFPPTTQHAHVEAVNDKWLFQLGNVLMSLLISHSSLQRPQRMGQRFH